MTLNVLLTLVLLQTGGEWELAERDEGLEVWTRERGGSSFDEVMARIRIAASAEQTWAVLEDVARYREFMPYLEDAAILERIGDSVLYQYQKIDPPILSARDVIMRVETERSAGVYRRRYHAAHHPSAPSPDEDTVRLTLLEGEWTVQIAGDDASVLTYVVFADPGGSVPAWAANYANTISIPRLMAALRQRVEHLRARSLDG